MHNRQGLPRSTKRRSWSSYMPEENEHNIRYQDTSMDKDQRGCPSFWAVAGLFGIKDTKTVVIKHHKSKGNTLNRVILTRRRSLFVRVEVRNNVAGNTSVKGMDISTGWQARWKGRVGIRILRKNSRGFVVNIVWMNTESGGNSIVSSDKVQWGQAYSLSMWGPRIDHDDERGLELRV